MSRNYLIFSIVSSALLMVSIDATVVTVALPAMLHELHTTLPLVTWSLTSYQLTQTIVLPLAGTLGDRLGRKRLFLWAIVIFSVGSIGAGLSPNITIHIFFRIIQAAGGGMFFPCAAGVVGDTFEEGHRQMAIGLFVTIFQIGGVIGPNLGGAIVDYLSWRWIFFINIPIGVAILLLGVPLIPRSTPAMKAERQHFDVAGTTLFAAGMFALLFGLTELADPAARPALAALFLAGGAGLLALFAVQETRTQQPIIDLKLILLKPFLGANMQVFMWSGAFNGFFNFIPYYAIIAYGMSATESGAVLTPRSLTAVVVSFISSMLIARMGYRRPWLIGIYLMALSMVLMSFGWHHPHVFGVAIPDFALLAGITFISGLSVGIAIPPSQNACFDILPDQMAAIAGLRAMFANSGAVIATTGVTLALAHSSNKVAGIQYVFLALGIIVFVSQAWVFLVPDMPSGGAGRPHELASSALIE
jgi:EmrB/QacA subfamily drug resistance transporter